MVDFELSLTQIVFTGLISIGCLLTGYRFRSRQLAKKNARIKELEIEMLDAHAEILETQKAYCELESKCNAMEIPVISIKNPAAQGGPEKKKRPDNADLHKSKSNRTA